MNYRHHFHAGNFADVAKHALLVQLLRALQKKEKGFLYLDTHAGRGGYDLTAAAQGDTLARKPEWPEGIGRLWAGNSGAPAAISDYVALVREFDRTQGNKDGGPRFYPGSPWFARQLARPQDRLALCEKQPDECAALRDGFQFSPRTTVHEMDGYVALRAMLPPLERRALVLIDPPFEAQNEFAQVGAALGEGFRRFASGVFAVWYPLTERARVDAFFAEVFALKPPPTLIAELEIAGEQAGIKMRGCGLLVMNPPWEFERTAASTLDYLGETLAQAPGAGGKVSWLVPEK
ncbi:MAG TPA: 23S rRNA (adenine(2030)-N(6))-methyltransferase RlmJ [Opitutaceae bacterium]|nr:23S rRNA (adenine(2030)-N(6))-methyltransferase RlmJ [Opitutaceae bacterium]